MEIIFEDDEFRVSEHAFTPKTFLQSHPRGVYTLGILRHLNDFVDHSNRLITSVSSFYNLKIDCDHLKMVIIFALSLIRPKFRFTFLVYLKDCALVCCLFIDQPPEKDFLFKSLWVAGSPRENPQIKDTAWISKRQDIIDRMPNGFHEAILHDQNGYFYEGLTSNICFVFASGIQTPKRDLVLPGLFLDKVEMKCKSLNIPFKEDMIKYEQTRECIGVFTTNMGRGIQWVDRIQISGATTPLWLFKPSKKIKDLQNHFADLEY